MKDQKIDSQLQAIDEQFNWGADVNRAYAEQSPLRLRGLLYMLMLLVIVLVAWAYYAEVDEVTRGEARVIPAQQVQIIQSQDGGLVQEIHIKEGDVVTKDQLLISLDATRTGSQLRESRAELLALQVKAERLSAVANGTVFTPSEALSAQVPMIVLQEQQLFTSNTNRLETIKTIASEQLNQRRQEVDELEARRRQLTESLKLAKRELEVTRPLVKTGAVSEVELLRLQREVNQFSGELEQAKSQIQRSKFAITEAENNLRDVELSFFNEIQEELARTTARVNALTETDSALSDRVNQTQIYSPVTGTVKQLYFNTRGGVISAGQEIAEIVPLDDSLLLEVKIQPRDIAFLRPGQETVVKFTAYDFVIYGGLTGIVEQIGADSIIDEEGNAFYNVTVRTTESFNRDDMPIIPGMVAEVDVLTGKKSVLNYLAKPILRAKQYALTER
ncbi:MULTISPECIES: HlyD family type I secretion periplasmic adaptor subunit [unclassified Marinobacterium]|uniref:HlyD family type I secretion periplasmic adaptor subunit n=1 Tax=unclassified Marinobacterium TaxID=2644139 RepID=UPI001569AACC|nr:MULTISPECIES: HlyD family type I secretion periplasmic adaptor subunit [unclassified Marinobacterium]NRP48016.1 Hemolysin secretion protein D, chromosomal [Marinobacterium sp. xm-d-543]NRQ24255.1 Hemolysin secretion protein D, chromosomal [Marinobacterium sp. xm-m-312]